MKLYWVRALFTVLVRCPVHTPVRTPMYELSLSQSDQRIRCVFQSVYNKDKYQLISRLTDQLLHNSLGKECPAAFRHYLSWLSILSNVLRINTDDIFLHSLTVVTGSCCLVNCCG